MRSAPNPSVVIVGSVGLDDLETPFGRETGCLGGSASYACVAASFFAPTGMVGVVGTDFPRRHVNRFRKRGIDLAGLPNLKGRVVPIAMDEWNYWHRDYVYGELGCAYDLADGLGVAAGLHEFFRQSDLIRMAHYAQTVNVIGAIKTTRTAAEMETTGLVLQLYRAHYGQIPLRLEHEFAPADVAAALTEDGKILTIGVMNPTDSEMELALSLSGATCGGPATRWHITGPDRSAHNTPGKPRVVDIQRTDGLPTASALRVPALCSALFAFPLK
jgi:alpha-N-arabinofuranosidase